MKPRKGKQSRKWSLHLLRESEAFYYAGLASSMHHQRGMLLGNADSTERAELLVREQNYLASCLRLMNDLTKDECPRIDLGMMFAVLQLFFLEVRMSLPEQSEYPR
jgi:hypothetical protein